MKNYYPVALLLLAGCAAPRESVTDTNAAFREKYRPQYHFTPPSQWMNDPNGMVYYESEFHLFYQHYPDSNVWGPMHWGHAVSKDLVSWEHLPIALYPDSLGYIFSGSAVVDAKNTSGLGTETNPPLVAIYTYHDAEGERAGKNDFQTQGIAYSVDKGRTWTKYENNPVLKSPGIKDFRDPKVSWYDDGKKWVMALAVQDHIRFYSSPNLLDWSLESEFGKDAGAHGGVWECPDLFPLTVEETGETKWVLLVSINPGAPNGGSGTQYFVGDFDGKAFKPDSKDSKWIDYGTDNYAGVTWSDVPVEDGRRVFLGWMSNWQYGQVVPTTVWRSAMTLPRNLELKKLKNGYVLHSPPVAEVEKLRAGTQNITKMLQSAEQVATDSLFELELSLRIPEDQKFTLNFSNDAGDTARLIVQSDGMYFDRTKSGAVDFEAGFAAVHEAPRPQGKVISLRIFVDVSSVEVFANEGEVVMTEIVFPKAHYSQLSLETPEAVLIESAVLHHLRSIWGSDAMVSLE